MATYTSKLNLKKPEGNELFNRVQDLNDNWDKIDAIDSSDITFTPTGNLSSTNVQTALAELDSEKANTTQEAWITPTLLNGWVVDKPVSYMKDTLGFVHIRGRAKSGTLGVTMFTLPTGYRPNITKYFVCWSGTSIGLLFIDFAGAVTPVNGVNTNFGLDTILFPLF